MAADASHDRYDQPEPVSPAELNDRLYRAYLAGDGPAVERIMALIAAIERRQERVASA